MSDLVLVTGGAGYVGAALGAAARERSPVRVLDVLLHDQDEVGARLEELGAEVRRGDIRDEAARRSALEGAGALVHLAAIVGDPACARDPELAQAVNVDATRAIADGARPRRRRAWCSPRPARTTGAWRTRRWPSTRPPSAGLPLRRAEGGGRDDAAVGLHRPDGRHLPAARDGLRRRGADALRPHRQRVHARPVGRPRPRGVRRAVLAPLRARAGRRPCHDDGARRGAEAMGGEVFNVGDSTRTTASSTSSRSSPASWRGKVSYVHRDEDPRDRRVRQGPPAAGLRAEHARAGRGRPRGKLDEGAFGDPWASAYRHALMSRPLWTLGFARRLTRDGRRRDPGSAVNLPSARPSPCSDSCGWFANAGGSSRSQRWCARAWRWSTRSASPRSTTRPVCCSGIRASAPRCSIVGLRAVARPGA